METISLIIDQSILIDILAAMQPICTKRTPLDITETVLFQISPRELVIKATDLEISLQCSTSVDANTTEVASFLVPGKRLYEIVKELDGQLKCLFDQHQLRISTDGGPEIALAIKPSTEFPPFPERIENLMQVDAPLLLDLLGKVAFLIPQNNANPALNGMLFECGPEGMAMVATDGHSLAKASTPNYATPELSSWLLPRRAVLELKKIIEVNEPATIFVGTCSGHLVFSGKDFNFFTRLIAQAFPQYTPVLNKEGFIPATVSREHFIKSLRRAGCLLDGKFVAASFAFMPGRINLKLENKEVGSLEESILFPAYQGDVMNTKFYTPYLLNGIQVVNQKDLTVLVKNESRPIMFESSSDTVSFTYLVMPVSATATGTR